MQDRGPLALTSFLFHFRFSPFSDTILRACILQNIAPMCLLLCVLQQLPAFDCSVPLDSDDEAKCPEQRKIDFQNVKAPKFVGEGCYAEQCE